MTEPGRTRRASGVRRPPPPFRIATVDALEPISPYLMRIHLTGDALRHIEVAAPASSIRLLIPPPGRQDLEMPAWTGNEFLLPTGERPVIRTLTPIRLEDPLRLDLDVVLHPDGALTRWIDTDPVGGPVAVSGPGRGWSVDPEAERYLLAGDESAIPALRQVLAAIPDRCPTTTMVEIRHPDGAVSLLPGCDAVAIWHVPEQGADPGDALVAAVAAMDIEDGMRVWAAGEARAMHRLRRHLTEVAGLSRSAMTVRGYWKQGR